MPEGDSSSEAGSRLWAGLLRRVRQIVTGQDHEPTLRESLEEAIDDADGTPAGGDDLGPVERAMLKNMLHFGEQLAGDIAVPRSDMVMFDADRGFAALVAAFCEAGHSRMPVWRGERDNIIGMAHMKDVFVHIAQDRGPDGAGDHDVTGMLREVLFVPASMRMVDLLARMRAGRTHMAIIVDEYGGTDGLVTIEDLVEEIVGDIEDEHDEDEAALFQQVGERLWEADARLPITALETLIGVPLADDAVGSDVDTLGGLVFMLAGRVPAPGETVEHPAGWRFDVIEGDPRMVRRVRVQPTGQREAHPAV